LADNPRNSSGWAVGSALVVPYAAGKVSVRLIPSGAMVPGVDAGRHGSPGTDYDAVARRRKGLCLSIFHEREKASTARCGLGHRLRGAALERCHELLRFDWKHGRRYVRRAESTDLKIHVHQTDRLGAQADSVSQCLGFVLNRYRIRSRRQVSKQIPTRHVGHGG